MALSVNEAWNSVALEERIELISKTQAQGIMASLTFALLMGAVGYGLDQIWILAGGVVGSFLVMPMFTSRSWRKEKPALILSYLAARSVARRYAFGFGIRELEIVLIFRGYIEDLYDTKEAKALAEKDQDVDFETSTAKRREVWICLLRGGVIAISEKLGGAKLEFVSAIDRDMTFQFAEPQNPGESTTVTIQGIGKAKNRKVMVTSNFPGALYVFRKQLGRLIQEANLMHQRLLELAAERKKYIATRD